MTTYVYKSEKLENLKKVFCEYFEINSMFLKNKSQKQVEIYHRQLYHYMAYELKYGSYQDIGSFCNNNHATIMNSHSRIDGYLSYDKNVKNDLDNLMGKVKHANRINLIINDLLKLDKKQLSKVDEFIKTMAA